MQTDKTTKALLGIIVFLSLWSPQAGMALQEESSPCDGSSFEVCRVQAEAGDANAQFGLGAMCLAGDGVVQDDARAYFWLNLAAAASQEDDRALAVENRERAAANLSPADRAAAQTLATLCQASGFQNCGEPE